MANRFGGILAGPLQDLPLLGEDLYLRMQALNLSVVDMFLRDLEANLREEYIALERTPGPSALFASALSQLWIFGLYELLRTWRQRMREALEFAAGVSSRSGTKRSEYVRAKRDAVNAGNPFTGTEESLRWKVFERIVEEPDHEATRLQRGMDATELLFRRLEALRMHLAKHEVPKQKGSEAMAPGYGRIDLSDGSITYQVLLRNDEVDMISRRTVADAVEHLSDESGDVFLPLGLREPLKGISETAYGIKQVKVTLRDGSAYTKVWVAWDRQVVAVLEYGELPFRASDIVALEPCTLGIEGE